MHLEKIAIYVFWFYILVFCYLPWIVKSQQIEIQHNPDKIKKRTIHKAVTFTGVYYAGSMNILGNTRYKDKAKVPFHFYTDCSGYLQVDKFALCLALTYIAILVILVC